MTTGQLASHTLCVSTMASPASSDSTPDMKTSALLPRNSAAISRTLAWLISSAMPIASSTGPIMRARNSDVSKR